MARVRTVAVVVAVHAVLAALVVMLVLVPVQAMTLVMVMFVTVMLEGKLHQHFVDRPSSEHRLSHQHHVIRQHPLR